MTGLKNVSFRRANALRLSWRAAAGGLFGIAVVLTHLICVRFPSHFVLKIAAVQFGLALPAILLYLRSGYDTPVATRSGWRPSPILLASVYVAVIFPLAWIINTNTSCADE